MILSIKTDNPMAELGLHSDLKQIQNIEWEAHRNLSDQLLKKIEQLLNQQDSSLQDLSGVVVFKGPGSFTGLRIGVTVANTLSYSLSIPIVGEQGDEWLVKGLKRLASAKNDKIVVPEYGGHANITKPKK